VLLSISASTNDRDAQPIKASNLMFSMATREEELHIDQRTICLQHALTSARDSTSSMKTNLSAAQKHKSSERLAVSVQELQDLLDVSGK
jgi:hypothetical protein